MGEVAKSETQESQTAMVSFIERAASDQSVDIEKFERLIKLKNDEEGRQAKRAFNAAMAELQSEMPTIAERGEIKVNNVVRSTFAKYEDIQSAVKPLLKKHGFHFSAKTNFINGALHVTGIVGHALGHSEETTMVLPFDNSGSKNNVQAIGSSVSYGKRYVFCMLFNIATGDDDDGQGAAQDLTISDEDAAQIKADLQRTNSDVARFCKTLGVSSVDSMPANLLNKARAMIKAKEQANANR